MTKKRKSDATRLDEVDRGMYTAFCSAANSLSQLYTQAMHQQRISFQAGERLGLEKLYSWILRQHEDGVRVTTGEILAYMQNELDYRTEEPTPSQTATQSTHSGGFPVSSNAFTPPTQSKNSVFSNALSSPIRHSLQHYQLSQGVGHLANNAMRSNENNSDQTRDHNPPSSNDTSMDMHADDSPGHDSSY